MLLRCRIAVVCALVFCAAIEARAQMQTLIEPVGTTSAVQTATVTMATSGTLSAINVLTLGAPNLDFKLAAGGTCLVGVPYSANTTCTVNYTFTPTHPGLRFGGISLSTSGSVVLGNAYVSGLGTGPQVIYSPAVQSLLGGPYTSLSGAAVDGAGDIFVSDQGGNAVYEITNGVSRQIGPSFTLPDDVAVDGSGNVFVIYNRTTLAEIQAINGVITAGSPTNVLYTNFSGLNGMKVDGSGNIYVAEGFFGATGNMIQEVLAVNGSIPANPTVQTLVSGVGSPTGIAIDAAGDLFFSDENGNTAWEVAAVSGVIPANPTPKALSTNLSQPSNIALDAAGNVFVTEAGDVAELVAVNGVVPANPTIVRLGSNLSFPQGMAVDGSGNIFIADDGTTQAVKLNFADAPTLTFATTQVGATSTDSPQTVSLGNDGNANLTWAGDSSPTNPTITAGYTFTSTCPTVPFRSPGLMGMIVPGGSCAESISFTPVAAGPDNGKFTLTDNNLNVSGVQTNIFLNATGTADTTTISITPNANPAFVLEPITLLVHLMVSGQPDPNQNVTLTYNPGTGPVVVPLTTDATGTAMYTISAGLPIGRYLITANFAGTTGQQASSFGYTQVVVAIPTTSVLTVFPATPTTADNVVLTATVSAQVYGPATGTVTFFNGAAALGTATLSSNATAQLLLTPLAAGSYTFGCTYNGAPDYATSTCAGISLTVTPPPDFSLTATPPSITIETQHHATMPLTLTSIGPFAGPVQLGCQGPLPPYVTCELPASETLTAGQTVNFNFTMDTDALLNFLAEKSPGIQSPWSNAPVRMAFAILLPLALAGFARRRKALRGMMLLVALAVGAMGLSACGNKWPAHTPPGTYTIPVVGTGTTAGGTVIAHTLNITLTVTP